MHQSMRIFDCTELMTQIYLKRIVDSIVKEGVPRRDLDGLKTQINQNSEELANRQRIAQALRLDDERRSNRVLIEEILFAILDSPGFLCSETELYKRVKQAEQATLERARSQDALSLSDGQAIEIYKTVLDVALNDNEISPDEFALLERLRTYLKVSRDEHRLLEAQIGKFPKPDSQLHTFEEFTEVLKDLQTRGILFYCNRADNGPLIVLPEELAPGVKAAVGFEMSQQAQQRMQALLTNEQLSRILRANGLPVSGSKTERSERLIQAGCKASEVLDVLQNKELEAICRKLNGVNVSGSKDERCRRIVEYFDSYTVKRPSEQDDPRAVFYEYFEELAHRKNQELARRKLIERDREMEAKFEEATRYLFERKLGCALIVQDGTDHADGAIQLPNGELLLWDNKSKEECYTFPKTHRDQFHRYIRESATRVNVFLVVVPDVDPQAKMQAMQLKHETATDTDIAVIRARDLKYVAENWKKYAKTDKFNPMLFNATGILERSDLDAWMKVVL